MNLDEALKNERNSAMVRGFLYICKCQNKSISIVEESLEKQLVPNNGMEGIMAMSLLSSANKNSVPPTKEEISILYSMLVQKFQGKDSMKISVDYGPEVGPVTDVLGEWFDLIRKQRQKEAETTGEKEKKLPLGWGLPLKSSMWVTKGCARENGIIDDHGNVMKISPHEIAYKSEKQEDIDRAYHLQPNRPYEWEMKIINRNIARTMGYTFIKDSITVCETENYGILSYLLETIEKFDEETSEIGFKILKSLCGYKIKNKSIVLTLFKKGLPVFNLKDLKGYFDEIPTLELVKKLDKSDLMELMKIINVAQNIPSSDLRKIKDSFSWVITIRYLDHEFCPYEFEELLRFWCNLHLEKGFLLGEIDDSLIKSWRLEICEQILKNAEDRGFKFYSQDCKENIIESSKY